MECGGDSVRCSAARLPSYTAKAGFMQRKANRTVAPKTTLLQALTGTALRDQSHVIGICPLHTTLPPLSWSTFQNLARRFWNRHPVDQASLSPLSRSNQNRTSRLCINLAHLPIKKT